MITDLIEALKIADKYISEGHSPTHCEHDVLGLAITLDEVSVEDVERLESLSFIWDAERELFISYRYGSC